MQRAGIIAVFLFLITNILQSQSPIRGEAAAPKLTHPFAPYAKYTSDIRMLPDTVRLLAVMVEFQEDNDNRTSGTGKFGSIYEYDYGTEILDPMPHDRAYFQHHLQFLENYVRKVSGRRTMLVGEVLDGIVTVDKGIADYSFRKNESEAPVARLAVEAWEKAVQQFPAVNFSHYDMFVVFHAGRGRDIDLVSIQGFDPTPFDIPSLSFTLNGFQRLLGENFVGIEAGQGFRITNCVILPTTNNREISNIDGSRSLLEITINGLLAASFGTWAGLPDLFNTENGKTVIGRFGLMDGEGIFAYGGICPPAPSAWEKQRLGWTRPRTALPGTKNYLVTAGDSLSTADVVRVPITDTEYWLVENRQRDLGGNGQLITYVSGGQVQQIRFPKDTLGFENGNVAQLKGVVIDVEDIDWSLPGGRVIAENAEARINGGILIWHIDENNLEERIAQNTVNVSSGGLPHTVTLVQAGGPQDIGVDIQTVFGTYTGSGSPIDYWTEENISPVYKNVFDRNSTPNTRANSGADTRVSMRNFSASGPVMTLDIIIGDEEYAPAEGFPVNVDDLLDDGQILRYIRAADLDGDGSDELIVAAGGDLSGFTLIAVRPDGSSFLNTGYITASEQAPLSGPPAVGDIDGDGKPDIAVILERGNDREVIVYKAVDLSNDGLFEVLYRQRFPAIGDRPVLLNTLPQIIHGSLLLYVRTGETDSILVVRERARAYVVGTPGFSADDFVRFLPLDEDGLVYVHSSDGGFAFSLSGVLQPVRFSSVVTVPLKLGNGALFASADVNGDRKRELIITRRFPKLGETPRLCLMSYELGSGDNAEARHLPDTPAGLEMTTVDVLACADIDGDGRTEIILSGQNGVLTALNDKLATVDYYPVALHAQQVTAVNGGGRGDILLTTGDRTLRLLRERAGIVSGYPVAFPSVSDNILLKTERGRVGIAAVNDQSLMLYELGNINSTLDLLWATAYADNCNSAQAPLSLHSLPDNTEFFPPDKCYNWPNPVYDGVTRIRFYVGEDAEVTVRIYDLAGDKVDELQTKAFGGNDNEILWNVSGIQSDIYLAHIEAFANGKKGQKIVKIAVVR